MGTLGGTRIQEVAETSWLQMQNTFPSWHKKLVKETQYWKVPHIQMEHGDPYFAMIGSILRVIIVHMHYDTQLLTGLERVDSLVQALLRLTIYSTAEHT